MLKLNIRVEVPKINVREFLNYSMLKDWETKSILLDVCTKQ